MAQERQPPDLPGKPPHAEADLQETREWYPGTGSVQQSAGRANMQLSGIELIGSRLDNCTIRALLGRGSMGTVFLAWHERLHRLCAVKVLSPDLARTDPRRLDKFFDEARSGARLQHPNIVAVHSLGEDQGYHFIEMEYVPGDSLKGILRKRQRLSPAEATSMVHQVAAALNVAHSQDVLHRDVKPANVLVDANQVAKLADFGLARIGIGRSGRRVVGTPGYMAPELFQGRDATPASDVYAMGVTYFSLMAGRLPYPTDSVEEMAELHQRAPLPDLERALPDVPQAVCSLVRTMISKDPAERPSVDAALVQRLRGLLNSLVPTRDLVARAMSGTSIEWDGQGERFWFSVRQGNGRTQRVEMEPVEQTSGGPGIVSFWSPCAPARSNDYHYALDINGRLPFGALGVRPYQGQPYFVMVQNHNRSTLDPEEIATTVIHMAEWADRVEADLTGGDVH